MAADAAEVRKQLGVQVKSLRIVRQWSQEELGARAGVSYKFVGEIERGLANPTVATLVGLAAALNVKISALFGEQGPSTAVEYQLSRREFLAVHEAKDSLDGILRRLGDLPVQSKPFDRRKRRRK